MNRHATKSKSSRSAALSKPSSSLKTKKTLKKKKLTTTKHALTTATAATTPTTSKSQHKSITSTSSFSTSFSLTKPLFAETRGRKKKKTDSAPTNTFNNDTVSTEDSETDNTATAAPRVQKPKKASKLAFSQAPLPISMTFSLQVNDPEVIAFLHDSGVLETLNKSQIAEKQQELANNALKIGVLALKSAQSKVDVHTIHHEIDRMMNLLQTNLSQHNNTINESVQTKLKEYFDPTSGRFEERIRRLLNKEDGELTGLIKQQVIKTSNTLADNLTPLIGPGSKLLTMLDPDNKAGLISLVQWAVGESNKNILSEFSLDNKNSSLRRLITELRQVSAESTTSNTEYLKELSLDNPKSALNRLIRTIETGQKEQLKQMSLDNTQSPISRLKLDIVDILNKQQQQLNNMEQLCLKEFSTLNASRNVYDRLSKRTTLHGLDFESRLFTFVQALISGVNPIDASNSADGQVSIPVSSYSSSDHIVARVGEKVGMIRNSKVGDILITMGPEHISAGAKIVIEAKADSSYNIQKAIEEIQVAKKNRGADIGVFVFAKQSTSNQNGETSHSTGPSIENLKRYGNDVIVVWDPEDPYTNVYVDAALSISKALLIRKQQSMKQTNNTLHELDTNIAIMNNVLIDLEKEMLLYDDIRKFAETIHSSTEKMLHRLKNSGGRVVANIEKLNQHIKNTKQLSNALQSAAATSAAAASSSGTPDNESGDRQH